MSYFPTDIPFMSDEELKENGIRIPKNKTIRNENMDKKTEAVLQLLAEAILEDKDYMSRDKYYQLVHVSNGDFSDFKEE